MFGYAEGEHSTIKSKFSEKELMKSKAQEEGFILEKLSLTRGQVTREQVQGDCYI